MMETFAFALKLKVKEFNFSITVLAASTPAYHVSTFQLLSTSMFVVPRLKSKQDNILCITLRNVTFFNSSSHSDVVSTGEADVTTVTSREK